MPKISNFKSSTVQNNTNSTIARHKGYPTILDIAKCKKLGIDTNNIYVYNNISLDEYQKISNDELKKSCKHTAKILFTGVVLAITAFLIFKSGKLDKQINNFCNFIHLQTKKKINSILDFSKAKSHFHNIGTNRVNQVSGAHEIRECIQTLLNESGNIVSIKPSKTQNGLFEIIYEINNIKSDTPKTVYVAEKLSNVDKKNLMILSGKYKSNDLLKSLAIIMNNKEFCNYKSMEKQIEQALRSGFIIKTPNMKKAANLAKHRISTLSSQYCSESSTLAQLEEIYKKAQVDVNEAKAYAGFNPKSEEFKQKLSILNNAKRNFIESKKKVDKLRSDIDNANQHYKHINNSVNIFAEKDGKLFGAFAHYEKGKLLVDSYFPIAHGSKMQSDFVEHCLNSKSLTINDIKCLIGAKKSAINNYFLNLCMNLKDWCSNKRIVRKSFYGLFAYSTVKSETKIKKLSKDREDATI